MNEIFSTVNRASEILRIAPRSVREKAIRRIAELITLKEVEILAANRTDIDNAHSLSPAMVDRLTLNSKRLADICASLESIASQPDPVGEILGGHTHPNGMRISKVRVPLGVVGIIYESRPNVTIDCAALCLRSGNACILRGGKEAINSNKTLAAIVSEALSYVGLPKGAVVLLDDPDRSKMLTLIQAVGSVDLIIPRGGENLIKFVTENARVPVVKHDKGLCHIYVDSSADFASSIEIINNAKVSRPSACNAVETVLVHADIADTFLPQLYENLKTSGVTIVTDADWSTEYLSLTVAVRVVENINAAIAHINKYGSGHSDAILTENYSNAQDFLNLVDSACVYVNASTRFTDGGEFGLGAEVGISTQKLHSRGPMGAYDLTTYKYMVYGSGQTR
ncbi:MAG: glutamate-5-semialdehyde dehydrogenase [Deferribacteraceae bacterium]|jgi:glutamate-5-semialdehyde dehydrogenase|nr:glutamate-5-semialdehyde dehydrogenase [Deferribacteraceae bacterium]